MADDTISSRLMRIETTQQYHGETLARVAVAVESMAVISERMSNHIEDAKRLHDRLDDCETNIVALQTQTAESHAFYRDMKRSIVALLSALLAACGWLLIQYLERRG